ncbi:RNA polymerase sigma factor [Virgibacillus doumboii]|uniref:RNA polymerase sigma factor n=1 Tax=Virgibacillus doumboii TaxID=2697503 RepID=UPI0013E03A9C|nr:RNA polymerase sigma factor [Virgibacillus doumboii]
MDSDQLYSQILSEYQDQLKGYCHKLAGVPWEGDDLFQETMMKAVKNKDKWSRLKNTKAYLFKIATNTWIDICRKRNITVDTYDDNLLINSEPIDYEVYSALEELVHRLPIRQAAIVLLIDSFSFSSKETATMLGMTSGAVKAALHRARTTLKKKYHQNQHIKNDNQNLIQLFLEAIKLGKPQEIVSVYHELLSSGFTVKRSGHTNGFYFEFYDPDGNKLVVFQEK